MSFPASRPRRLRASVPMRRLVAEGEIRPSQLVLPLFVKELLAEPAPIPSMPGVMQHTTESLRIAAEAAVGAGVGGLMLFGIPTVRDAVGSEADAPDGVLNKAVRTLAADLGSDTVLMADLCLDEFTDHGHCGVLDARGRVDNDATLERYAAMSLALAESGAHVLGASGMMDGQVAKVRSALDAAGGTDVAILAYAAKYASALYGPFRDAVDSALVGDRRTYQMDTANAREGLREVQLDIAEGADIIMVKPAGWYLDVLADAARVSPVPVAAYQISGEYSMLEAAAANGWIDRKQAVLESLTAINRAGADLILTYWATEAAQWLR